MKEDLVKFIALLAAGIFCLISFAVLASGECDSDDDVGKTYNGRTTTYYPSVRFTMGIGVMIWIVLVFECVVGMCHLSESMKAKLPEAIHLDSLCTKWTIRVLCFLSYTAAVTCSSVNTELVDKHEDDDTPDNEKFCTKYCKDFCSKIAAGAMFMWFTFFALLFLVVYQDIEIWRMCARDSSDKSMAQQDGSSHPSGGSAANDDLEINKGDEVNPHI